MPETNNLACYENPKITTVKSFIIQAPCLGLVNGLEELVPELLVGVVQNLEQVSYVRPAILPATLSHFLSASLTTRQNMGATTYRQPDI